MHKLLSAIGRPRHILRFKGTKAGDTVQSGAKLRILPVGDSITVGFGSERNGGDGNGYRGRLKESLCRNEVIFAGMEKCGEMSDGYFAAWSGKTIQFISDHVDESLDHKPNLVLLAAGTNDMNSSNAISTEGNDPKEASKRLGVLIDKIVEKCPDATVLVAMIVFTCDEMPHQKRRTAQYQKFVAEVVKERYDEGKKVLAVDFSSYDTSLLSDCVHPTNEGYRIMGDWWYDFITQIPKGWIQEPRGKDPVRA